MKTKTELICAFRTAGLAAGDLVLVHSALRKLGPVEGGADTVIDALLEVVGNQGTLAMATHTFRLVHGAQPVFHQTLTPTNVGALSNVFRKRPGVLRGLHPTHSVAAIGPRAAEFIAGHELDDTPCSATSPYGRLRDWGGKVLIIGVGLECCTFFHGCEQWAHMPGALTSQTVQLYSITAAGQIIPVTMHQHYVNTWDQYPRLEPHLIQLGVLRVSYIGDCALRVLQARPAADWLVARLSQDPSIIMADAKP